MTEEQAPQTLQDRVIDERFRVRGPVTEGGMARIYRAQDERTGEPAAVKVLALPSEQGRFERECGVLERLRHPAVVPLLSHGRLPGGVPWLAMPWLEGRDLAAHLAERGEPGRGGHQLRHRVAQTG